MIPYFYANINSDDEGIYNISLVDAPAVESNFLAFNKQEQLTFSIQNEEQRKLLGVIMRAEYPIYRFDEQMGEFYIKYSKETVKLMAEKLMKDQHHNNINIMHSPNSNVDGVYMTSLFIKDTEKGINPTGFEDIENGSLFAEYHVLNDEIWSSVKDGTFKGFSLEGLFTINKDTKKEENMSVKTELMNALLTFGEVETKTETLYWEGEEDLKAGDAVFVGEDKTPAPDGDYETMDGKIIKVEEGKVKEIVDPEAEVDSKEEETPETKEEEMEEETTETTTTTEETTTEETTEEPKDDEVAKLKEEVEVLKAEVETLKKAIEEINAQLSMPAVPPIEQEFEKVTKPNKNEVKKNRALSILSHLND